MVVAAARCRRLIAALVIASGPDAGVLDARHVGLNEGFAEDCTHVEMMSLLVAITIYELDAREFDPSCCDLATTERHVNLSHNDDGDTILICVFSAVGRNTNTVWIVTHAAREFV